MEERPPVLKVGTVRPEVSTKERAPGREVDARSSRRNKRALSRCAQTEVTRLLPGEGSAGCGGGRGVSGCNREPTTDQALGRCYQPRRRGGKPQRRRAATVRLPQHLGKLDRCGAAR